MINNMKSRAKTFAKMFTSPLKESKFKETGVITADEFVFAGDFLVHHCPSWQWASGDEAKLDKYLPREKQFLVTKNVPCFKRYKDIECVGENETVVEEDDGEGGWVDTHYQPESSVSKQMQEMTMEPKPGPSKLPVRNQAIADEDDDDDGGEIHDMEACMGNEVVEDDDEATLSVTIVKPDKIQDLNTSTNVSVVALRTYDLNITYDQYYRTPRLWLLGYDENRKPLTIEEMYEDISHEHAKKTVTMESHPHLPGPQRASIHPCRHSEVMKRLIQTVADGGGELEVHEYIIIFLKFMQAVIPTIEYDFTQNFSLERKPL